jgi:hypothetical protein
MATTPSFATVPRIGMGQVTVANAGRDGSGTVVTILTGAATGTRIAEVVVQAIVTTTAGMVRLFLSNGVTTRLLDEVSIAVATPSASVKATRVSTTYNNLVLPDNTWSLIAATNNAEAANVIAFGADL